MREALVSLFVGLFVYIYIYTPQQHVSVFRKQAQINILYAARSEINAWVTEWAAEVWNKESERDIILLMSVGRRNTYGNGSGLVDISGKCQRRDAIKSVIYVWSQSVKESFWIIPARLLNKSLVYSSNLGSKKPHNGQVICRCMRGNWSHY